MCKLLSNLAISLACVTVFEAAFYSYQVIAHQDELSPIDLVMTAFINLTTLFFAAVLIDAVLKSNLALLRVWIIYGVTELVRSSFEVYRAWVDPIYDRFERFLISCDAGLQVSTIIVVVSIIKIIIKRRSDCRSNISSLGRSAEQLNKKTLSLEM